MPAVPASFIEPLWVQFEALIPARVDTHPLGCHRRRVADRVVFDKLVARVVLGGSYQRHADDRVSATTLRARRDEWITAGVFDRLEQAALEACDTVVGLDLGDLVVDGCIVNVPCDGDNTGKSPVDRAKSGLKRSLLVEGAGIPIGCELAGANRHDSPLLRDDPGAAEQVRVRPARDHHGPPRLRLQLRRHARAAQRARLHLTDQPEGSVRPDQPHPPLEGRTHELLAHPRLRALQIVTDRSEAIQRAWIALANAIIIVRRLIRTAWTIHRWDT